MRLSWFPVDRDFFLLYTLTQLSSLFCEQGIEPTCQAVVLSEVEKTRVTTESDLDSVNVAGNLELIFLISRQKKRSA